MTSQVEVPPLTGLIHFNSGKRRVNPYFLGGEGGGSDFLYKSICCGYSFELTLEMA